MKKKSMTIEGVEEIAVSVMERTGEHKPQMLAENSKGQVVLICFPMPDEAKEEIVDGLRNFVLSHDIVRYFIVCEAWFSVVRDDLPAIMPRRRLDRKEALIILEFGKDMKHRFVHRLFHRDNKNKIV